jgi:hypothetical protein
VPAYAFSADGQFLYYAERMTGELVTVSTADRSELNRADTKYNFSVNVLHVLLFRNPWTAGHRMADRNDDGSVSTADVLCFLSARDGGCSRSEEFRREAGAGGTPRQWMAG